VQAGTPIVDSALTERSEKYFCMGKMLKMRHFRRLLVRNPSTSQAQISTLFTPKSCLKTEKTFFRAEIQINK
jgi:hypothetical protein